MGRHTLRGDCVCEIKTFKKLQLTFGGSVSFQPAPVTAPPPEQQNIPVIPLFQYKTNVKSECTPRSSALHFLLLNELESQCKPSYKPSPVVAQVP